MPRAKRPCPEVGCPELTNGGRCKKHRADAEKARGTKQARGYDATHDALRGQLQLVVNAGRARCWRCGRQIPAGDPWHLGHDDHDRTRYRGIECPPCNLSAGGRAAHQHG